MSCPWAKVAQPQPVSFEEIMSEQVARDLQAKEEQKYSELVTQQQQQNEPTEESGQIGAIEENPEENAEEIPQEILNAISASADSHMESDALIAQMLQMQFDKEYDENLRKTQDKVNGTAKVSISYENYRRVPKNFDFESDSEEEEPPDLKDRPDWDRFDALEREYNSIPACGYKKNVDGTMVTKHDVTMSGRKNACKMLSFPPEFATGDGENFDLKLSNKVFNSLKRHSNKTASRRHKHKDKKDDRATAEFGMDEFTRMLVYKMINREMLEQVNGVVSIGKEAVILHANANEQWEERPLPAECVLKIFKTSVAEFKQRDKYIKDDHRFKDRIGNQTARKTVHLWAEKEMHNLTRLKNAKVPCPEVVFLSKHVLVMSFIGEDNVPAPKLKDASLDQSEYIVAYDQVVDAMKTLFNQAELIHADLSEYNILWHRGECVFIDVSQAVMPAHENAFFFLMRDCNNITNFFAKKKVPEVVTAEELFKSITGCEYNEKEALVALQERFKMKPHLVDKPGIESAYNFDTAWEKSKQDQEFGAKLLSPLA